MFSTIKNTLIKPIKKIFLKDEVNDMISFENLNLPLIRTNEGLENNEDYLNSGRDQLEFLKSNNLINENSKILDFGCGQGRIANSIAYGKIRIEKYIGIDTDQVSVDWCKKYLKYEGRNEFIHLPAFNSRYNNTAEGLRTIPFENNYVDLIFLNSVFSHMLADDILFYLAEFNRILNDNGSIYITAFIEENVPNVEENPENYLAESSGNLHRVRYDKKYFFSLVEQSNLKVANFYPNHIQRTQQSVILLTKA